MERGRPYLELDLDAFVVGVHCEEGFFFTRGFSCRRALYVENRRLIKLYMSRCRERGATSSLTRCLNGVLAGVRLSRQAMPSHGNHGDIRA